VLQAILCKYEGCTGINDVENVVVVVFQCHHMSVMDFVVSLLIVAEV
jgi:hypothetical protein